MAINQPRIGDDQADNSWKLEVTTQANTEESRVNALVSRIEALEGMMGITSGGGVVSSVDTDPPSILRLTNGRLSTVPVSGSGALQVTNYVQLVQDVTQLEYTFSGAGNLSTIPHQVFVGGQKLIETMDYNPSSTTNGRVILTRQLVLPTVPVGDLLIELSVWSL